MKKGFLIAVGILCALMLAVLVALLVMDRKYEFLFASPRISHDTFVTQDTCAQLVIRPEAANKQIPALFPNSKIPPAWLGKVLPYEIAIFGSTDAGNTAVGLTVFVNDRRLAPLIRQAAPASQFQDAFPSATWSTDRMTRETRGNLSLTGAIPIDKATADTVANHWNALASFNKPLTIDTMHFVELALDNRAGGAFALIASLSPAGSPQRAAFRDENTVKVMSGVSVARLTADLDEGNTAVFDLEIQTNPQANMIFAIKLLLDAAVPQFNETLKRTYGASLEGKSTTENDTVKGHYVLTNVDRILIAASGSGAR